MRAAKRMSIEVRRPCSVSLCYLCSVRELLHTVQSADWLAVHISAVVSCALVSSGSKPPLCTAAVDAARGVCR